MEALGQPDSDLPQHHNLGYADSTEIVSALESLLAQGRTDIGQSSLVNDTLYRLANEDQWLPHEDQLRPLYEASAEVGEALDNDELTSDEEDLGPQMQHVMSQPDLDTKSEWFKVGPEPLTAQKQDSMSVWSWSAMTLNSFLQGSMTFAAFEMLLQNVSKIFTGKGGACGPHNPDARFPQSKKAIEKCLGVPPLHQYEIHVCWNERCTHWWPYVSKLNHRNAQNRPCTGTCTICTCPCCGESRWRAGCKKGTANVCYFFPSVLDQFFLDEELCVGILAARHHRTATFHKTAKYQQLVESCVGCGFDQRQVYMLLYIG